MSDGENDNNLSRVMIGGLFLRLASFLHLFTVFVPTEYSF